MKSVLDLVILCNKYGIKLQPFFIHNESLITRARNYLADEFLRSDSTHLFFVDADIIFDPKDVLALLQIACQEGKDIVCGPYPKKNISWEKVKKAVDKAFGDPPNNPEVLASFAGDFVFNAVHAGKVKMSEPFEVAEAGTGFMMINRYVFEKFTEAYPQQLYNPDHKRSKEFQGDRQITAFFMDPLEDGRHLSEDYMFCKWSRKIGMKVWLCPWMKVHHFGSIVYIGNLPAIAAAGLSATIDPKDVRKNQKAGGPKVMVPQPSSEGKKKKKK